MYRKNNGGRGSTVRALDCDSGGWGFESPRSPHFFQQQFFQQQSIAYLLKHPENRATQTAPNPILGNSLIHPFCGLILYRNGIDLFYKGVMSDFTINFDLEKFKQLDEFALLVDQEYNLGNRGDWLMNFRGGLYGFYSRLHGIKAHYEIAHTWLPTLRSPTETEYHLSSILFNMDSAVECLTYALNALGYAVAINSFRDVSDARELKKINPKDIIGDNSASPPRPSLDGYAKFFPKLASLWQSKSTMLNRIFELHDVSKHRQTISVGGRLRSDPPPGFYESLGILNNSILRILFAPSAEIILQNDPKTPWAKKIPEPAEGQVLLEEMAAEFVVFIHDTGDIAIDEAKANIVIPVQSFK